MALKDGHTGYEGSVRCIACKRVFHYVEGTTCPSCGHGVAEPFDPNAVVDFPEWMSPRDRAFLEAFVLKARTNPTASAAEMFATVVEAMLEQGAEAVLQPLGRHGEEATAVDTSFLDIPIISEEGRPPAVKFGGVIWPLEDFKKMLDAENPEDAPYRRKVEPTGGEGETKPE
jgi:hypothetical protein